MKILIHVMLTMVRTMSSTNNANVIERVLNNKTFFNYLFVSDNINVR